MDTNPNDFHVNLSFAQTVITVGTAVAVWIGSLWRMARVASKKESDLYAAIEKNKTDVNQLGERVNLANGYALRHEDAINSIKLEQQASRDDRSTMRERIARNEASISALTEELAQERLAVMTTLHNNEKAAAERDAQTREQLARISERLDIERMVTSVVRNLKV